MEKTSFYQRFKKNVKSTVRDVVIAGTLFGLANIYGPQQLELTRPAYGMQSSEHVTRSPSPERPLNVVFITDEEFKHNLYDRGDTTINSNRLEMFLNRPLLTGDKKEFFYPGRTVSSTNDSVAVHTIRNASEILPTLERYSSNNPIDLLYINTHGFEHGIGPQVPTNSNLTVSKVLTYGGAHDLSHIMARDGNVLLHSCSTYRGSTLTFAESLAWLLQAPVTASRIDIEEAICWEKTAVGELPEHSIFQKYPSRVVQSDGLTNTVLTTYSKGDFAKVAPLSDQDIAKKARKGWLVRKIKEFIASPE